MDEKLSPKMEEKDVLQQVMELEQEMAKLEMNILGLLDLLENAVDEDNETLRGETENLLAKANRKLEIKKEKVAILSKYAELKKPTTARDSIEPFRMTGDTTFIRKKRVVVPTGLPKFRQGNMSVEPVEFIENFEKIMAAHEIDEDRNATLLALCLDSVDNQWLENWQKSNPTATWRKLTKEFVSHFQHPNAMVIWQDQIYSLKMDKSGSVQRYTDQFI